MTVHDEQLSPRDHGTSDTRKAVRGAAIGNTVEWFDFAVYSVLATYIADKFFPSGNDTVALLNTFAIFAAAFFMRPRFLWWRRQTPTSRGNRSRSSLLSAVIQSYMGGDPTSGLSWRAECSLTSG